MANWSSAVFINAYIDFANQPSDRHQSNFLSLPSLPFPPLPPLRRLHHINKPLPTSQPPLSTSPSLTPTSQQQPHTNPPTPTNPTTNTGTHTYLLRLTTPHPRPDLAQTLAHEQDPIDQQPVRRALDLEVAEKGIGAKQREHLVERVVGLRVRVDVDGGGGGGKRGEGVCGAAGAGAQGEECDVACWWEDIRVRGVSQIGGFGVRRIGKGEGGRGCAYRLVGHLGLAGRWSGRPVGRGGGVS
ncbi:hypothetical protein MMC06_004072 [Schaereria dolodes]|nr:hypothetical protein [Schaereria dolodes]